MLNFKYKLSKDLRLMRIRKSKNNIDIDADENDYLLLSALPEAFVLINCEGRIIYWNPVAEKLFGFSKEEAVGKELHQLITPLRLYEDYKEGFKKFRSTGNISMNKKDIELVAVKKSGVEFPVEISLSSIKIKGLWHAMGIIRDVSEKKEKEYLVQDMNRILRMFSQNLTRKDFLDTIVELIKSYCGCRYAGVMEYDKKGSILFESYGCSEDFILSESPSSVHNDNCACIKAITSKPDPKDIDVITPHGSYCYHNFLAYINKLNKMTRYSNACATHGFRSVAVVPIRYNKKLIGLIYIADEKKGIFSKDLIEFVETLSCIIGEAIAKFDAEEELARLASAAESAADAIVITDKKGLIQYINPAFEQITGYTKDEVIGKNIHLLDSGEQIEDFYIEIRETLKHKGVWKGMLVNRKKDGSLYHEECTISAVRDSSGNIINYVAIKRDVTEKIRLESIAQAVNIMNNIGYIFSGIRHEIGNPLNSIKMTLSMLKENFRKFDTSAINEYLERSIDEIRRVEYILKSFKNFNMYEHLELQNIPVKSFMDKFLTIIKDDFYKRGISFSLHQSPDVDYCYADPRALHQVLLNVLINAADACIGRKNPMISISVSGSSETIDIKVQDNGCGMSEDQVRNLFRPFFTTKPDGTGLGLVITKKMLSLMNGTIEIHSIKDKGTTVNILLPRGSNDL
jgi:PAS domain S-box-containing protein